MKLMRSGCSPGHRMANNDFYVIHGDLENTPLASKVDPTSGAFEMIYTSEGRKALNDYYSNHLSKATPGVSRLVLETPTWRANPDRICRLGFSRKEVVTINRHATQFVRELLYSPESRQSFMIAGCIGPRNAQKISMSIDEATTFHLEQVAALALADVDYIIPSNVTMTSELLGIVNAARTFGIPVLLKINTNDENSIRMVNLHLGD